MDKLADLPTQPGVYMMRDCEGNVIYVGKAKNLRNRLRSYLHPERLDAKVKALMGRACDVEYIVTANELEALILESNLIKEKRPHYNIELRDDKQYPYLKITNEPYPRLVIVRRFEKDGSRYFGPFVPTNAIRSTLRLIYKIFRIRSCNLKLPGPSSGVPCINYEMGRCLAPCIGKVSQEEYSAVISQVVLFLQGKNDELVDQLRSRMNEAARRLEFERAAVLRDQIAAIGKVRVKQKVTIPEYGDKDIIGVAIGGQAAAVVVFFLRGGLIVGRREFLFNRLLELSEHEVASAFIKQYYLSRPVPAPGEILVPAELLDQQLLCETLSAKNGRRVSISVPKRGPRRGLLAMAMENASVFLQAQLGAVATGSGRSMPVGALELGRRLSLQRRIERVDVFDNSILFGSWGVGVMIVWQDGGFKKGEYRRFKIKSDRAIDDVGMMREVLTRRYTRAQEEGARLPDVVLVDGGKAQVNVAREVLSGLGIDSAVVLGIAKARGRKDVPDDIVYLQGQPEPLGLASGSDALLFLKRLRDEAHRFAIAYHRKLRSGGTLRSALLSVPGIGPKRMKRLLREFGSLKALAQAPLQELLDAEAIDEATAKRLFDFLHFSQIVERGGRGRGGTCGDVQGQV